MEYKAIETHYNGYRFRSRLEARWAVFFDEAGIKYEYEPEGFEKEVDGELIRYLPDFYFPDYDWYGEVKPPREGAEKEIIKASYFVGDAIKVLVLFGNIPSDNGWEFWHYTALQYNYLANWVEGCRVLIGVDEEKSKACFIGWLAVDQERPYAVNEYTAWKMLEPISDIALYGKANKGWSETENEAFAYSETYPQECELILRKAYKKARQARFEYGENG